MIVLYHLIACTLGLIIDRLIGDPPKLPHPIRWIGNYISFITKKFNRGKHLVCKGIFLTVLVVSTVCSIVLILSIITYKLHWGLYIAFQTIVISIGLAQKSLADAAMAVYEPLMNNDIDEARTKLSWIVGRDTDQLDESSIARGVIETVSENTSDGVTAPLFWGMLFGATGLWSYKAINTLDSMVGYKNERFEYFGKCAAKLDDLVNLIPSRLTGLLIILCTSNTFQLPLTYRIRHWLKDAKKHPSPNSGYLEAATALQFGIQLGGINYYEGVPSHRATMGESYNTLKPVHIKQVIIQMKQAVIACWVVFIILGGIIIYATNPWS